MQKNAEEFFEYDRLAKLNSATSDLTAHINALEANIYKFLNNKEEEAAHRAREHFSLAAHKVKECLLLTALPARRAVLEHINGEARELQVMQDKVIAMSSDAYAQYRTVAQPALRELWQSLLAMSQQAGVVGNVEAALAISKAMDSLGRTSSTMSRFAENRSREDSDNLVEYIHKLREKLNGIAAVSDSAKKQKAQADKAFVTAVTKIEEMRFKYAEVEINLYAMRKLMGSMLEAANKLSSEVDMQTQALAAEMRAETAVSQKNLFGITALGLLGGIVCAMLIIAGLLRALKDMSAFAEAIARGDFRYQLRVNEKGEIGATAAALMDIPKTLDKVLSHIRDLALRISSGHMRERMNDDDLPGSFSEIARYANAAGDAYINLLDSMEIPIMACDKSYGISFLNRAGRKMLGGDMTGMKCADLFNAPQCGTSQCLGKRAMEQSSSQNVKAEINIGGVWMNMAVTVLPLCDLNGCVAGYVEIVSDLAEIRMRQNLLINVMAQTSDISGAKAPDGSALVNQVVEAINTINAVADNLKNNMRELGNQAEGIGGVMNVIADIADHTNRLALDATIEAARAGEAGRGFALVADEVRKLAEKTMRAAREVEANITAVRDAAGSVNEDTDPAKSSDRALEKIAALA